MEGDHPAGGEHRVLAGARGAAERTVTERPSASFIWEATVRIQIRLVEPELVPVETGLRRGAGSHLQDRIASCASWAFLTLEVYVRGWSGTYSAP